MVWKLIELKDAEQMVDYLNQKNIKKDEVIFAGGRYMIVWIDNMETGR